jgi:hypothetical protein
MGTVSAPLFGFNCAAVITARPILETKKSINQEIKPQQREYKSV